MILTYGRNQQGAADTAAAIEKAGGTAVALHLDLGGSDGFDGFRDSVAEALRTIWNRDTFDHLVNRVRGVPPEEGPASASGLIPPPSR
ncbi:hypothetical protein [Streptomyces sp. NBC_01233]|uniref:hypothetical protein n=1 Tax=Streptomyces sp. NBC_01233 TaxID=2903787 RepID=UPI002E144B72|nr:hypothetical protein OG332_02215 [Streptomyces sp. NBC_01233]